MTNDMDHMNARRPHRTEQASVVRRLRARGARDRASQQAGFTLLLAALVASIVLALGSAIFSIAQKQLTLSSIGRDSQFAFYAADTAAECALYWDFRRNYFATTTPAGISPDCDHKALALSDSGGKTQPYTFPYTLTYSPIDLFTGASPNGRCAQITVTKSLGLTGAVRTVIHADGYSTSCASISTNARALQRSVELHY